jgi:hypothetical protein
MKDGISNRSVLEVNRLGIASREVWCLGGGAGRGLGIYMNTYI